MNSSVKYGVIIGVVGVVFTAALYMMGPEIASGKLTFLMLPISIAMYVYFGIQCRKENGGYFTFGEAFKAVFVMGLVGTLIGLVFQYVLYGIVDPDFYRELVETQTRSSMGMFGADESVIEDAMSKMSDSDFAFTPGKMLIGLVVASAIGAIGAAIIGAIIKKQDPETANF